MPSTAAPDERLLRELFAESHGPVLDGLAPHVRDRLLDLQYAARAQQYAAAYPRAQDRTIERDGVAVGRILVAETERDLHVVDIAVRSDERGRGLGGRTLRALCARADRDGRSVSLSVSTASPARRLYARLGFEVESADAVEIRMRRRPGGRVDV